MDLVDRVKKFAKKHTVESASILVVTTPTLAAIESLGAGMEISNSVNARLG